MFLFQRTFAYLAYDLDDRKTIVIELEYHYGVTQYTKGTSYDQVRKTTWDYTFQSQSLIFMIQECRKQVERKEGCELQLVMTMVTCCQWDSVTLVLKS